MGAQPTFIKSVRRALRLLDVVGDADRPLSAKSLARAAALPLPTVYHLVRTLVHEGYLRRIEGGYVLGDRIAALSSGPGGSGLRPARSHEVLAELRDGLHAAAYLSVLGDGEVRLVDVVDSPDAPRADLWVGFHDAAHATALGKAVLATLPAAQRRDYLSDHPLADLTHHTVTDARALMRELEAAPGYSLDREEYALGTACVAVAVPSASFSAAVAVSVPSHRLGRVLERREKLVRAARLIAFAGPEETAGASITM